MKALVTGASGFIGRHLAWRLANMGDEVTCFVRHGSKTAELERMGVNLLVGDVTRPRSLAQALEGVDVVYHLAGIVHAVGSDGDLWSVNESGVGHLADACAQRGDTPPTLVHISSLAAVGPAPEGRALTESDPPRPVSAYGRSKLAGERAARSRFKQVPITVLRPPMVFGEGDVRTFEFFRLAARGWYVVPGQPQQPLSLIHVADLTQLIVRAAEVGERLRSQDVEDEHGVYFAAHPESVTFAELGARLGRAVGRENLRVVAPPPALAWGVAAIAELAGRVRGRSGSLTLDKAREATAGGWLCSGAKALDGLGVRLGMTLEQRMAQTAAWYRAEGWFE